MFNLSFLIYKYNMRKLILYILFSTFAVTTFARNSPHGANFKIDCAVCHTVDNWKKIKDGGFNHNKTRFPLVGQHKTANCRQCHKSLDFSKAPTDCASCHTDIHQGTVGRDCQRCHKPTSWIVSNIKQIHRQTGFPLVGAHATADCNRCHVSASLLRFDNIRTDCYACHKAQYDATQVPNHRQVGFDTDCARCHNMVGRDWNSFGKGFDHGGFPLTGGHKLACDACHIDNNYKVKLSPNCSSCHGVDNSNPVAAHQTKFKAYDCSACHSPKGWNVISFKQHDGSFGKIYSGKHKGKWSSCTDCHSNDANYTVSCKKCHDFQSGQLP
jgi:hypothetical protein